MNNIRIAIILIIKALLIVSALVVAVIYLRYFVIDDNILKSDLSGISVMVSFIATLYTLISAFVLIEVWNQYNSFSSLVDKESLLLKSLWKYTDYFNDNNLDEKMEVALKNYVDVVEKEEIPNLVKGTEVITPSKETEVIGSIIDEIKFNDTRDSIAFSSIIKVYDDFISVRNERNAAGITRLPFPMRFLFIIFSIILVFVFSLLGFNSLIMYVISLGAVTFGVIITYSIVQDLDNPLGGLFSFEGDAYKGVISYIQSSQHKKD